MPDYELHADYDRDGKLTATAGEYALRLTSSALLRANLDRDDRPLPATVAPGKRVAADSELQPRRDDDEPAGLVIRPNVASFPDVLTFLKFTGFLARRLRLLDDRRSPITPFSRLTSDYQLKFDGKPLSLRVEATTLPGSPLLRAATLSTKEDRYEVDEGMLLVQLYSVGYFSGKVTQIDQAVMKVAPVILASELAPARRLYIAELEENEPSQHDVEAALAGSGVEIVRVPRSVAADDAWLQDQFQMAYCQTPDGVMDVVIHLPRLQANAVESNADSRTLAPFVDSHFRSRNIAVFDDFWKRTFPVIDASGKRIDIDFTTSHFVNLALLRAQLLRSRILTELAELTATVAAPPTSSYTAMFGQLGSLMEVLSRALDSAAANSPAAVQKLLREKKDDLKRRLSQLAGVVGFTADQKNFALKVKTPSGEFRAVLTPPELDRLVIRLRQVHDGTNYGGNIEASPPLPNAPHGVIVIGNVHNDNGSETADPDLLHFLRAQKLQPLVEVNTTWLSVGHVDEIFSFVPSPSAKAGFAIALAAPKVALSLLRAAERRYIAGARGVEPDNFTFETSRSRRTTTGKSPVTMAMRGREWLHHHTAASVRPLEPPRTYMHMATLNAAITIKGFNIPFTPGAGEDRTYPAQISVRELLSFAANTNELLQSKFIDSVETTLQAGFAAVQGDVEILPVPVLYDRMEDVEQEQTGAFLPNIANAQIVGKRMLIPRPCAPRMSPTNAIAVVGETLDEFGFPNLKPGLTVKSIEKRGLNRLVQWVKAPLAPLPGSDADALAEQFADGFPGAQPKDVVQKIMQANPRSFDAKANLKPGWQQVAIPENTVDLFELYTQTLLESVGVEVHFVDSWYYHVRLGEIHCGTNVLRHAQPQSKSQTWWLKGK